MGHGLVVGRRNRWPDLGVCVLFMTFRDTIFVQLLFG